MAMVQFNLLPDVKLAYIKAERQKQIVLSISVILSIGAVVLFVLLFSYANIVQKKAIADLTKDISSKSKDLTGTKDLSKILTVQNQINSLARLHETKVLPTRLLDDMEKMTPASVEMKKLEADYTAGTISVEGTGTTIVAINIFADSLKFTKFTVKDEEGKQSEKQAAFTEVVLSTINIEENELPGFKITAKYNADLFVQNKEVTLNVPKMVTTRSVTERPGALFGSGGSR